MLFDAFYFRSRYARVDNKKPRYVKFFQEIEARSYGIVAESLGRRAFYPRSLLVVLGLPAESQINFQLPASSIMEGIVTLHHDMMFFLVFISVFVLYILTVVGLRFSTTKTDQISQITHHSGIEII